MGGIVGLIGDGSLGELQDMAGRMAYRGRLHAWSPAPDVYLGELSHSASTRRLGALRDGSMAIDTAGYTTPRDEIEATLESRGAAAAGGLHGFFAAAWWDDRSRTLKFICDRHGYKTLYLARLPGRIAFASDLKALLALADMPAVVDRDVLQMYLRSRSFPAERSLLSAAQPIGGSSVWTLSSDGQLTSTPYWTPALDVKPGRSFDAAAAELRELLRAALTKQLAGREQIAIALSGGLDSASVLALARDVRPDLRITSYTVGHSDSDPEILRAREAAAHFGTEHRECFLPPEQVPDQLQKLVWLTEDLTGREEAALQQVLAAEMSDRGETAYLAGHGADVAFAGMPRHRLLWMRDHSPPPLRGALNEAFIYTQRREEPHSWLGQKLAGLAFHGDRPTMPTVTGAGDLPSNMNYRSLDEYCGTTIGWIEGMRFHEPVETETEVVMVAPLFDPSVVRFALGCPTAFKIDRKQQKRVLRAAVDGLLPPSISQRGKMIQRMKHDTALSDVLDDFASSLRLKESLAERGLLPVQYLSALQSRSRSTPYSSERLHILWASLCAELWLRQFIDERGATPPELSKAAAPFATVMPRLATA